MYACEEITTTGTRTRTKKKRNEENKKKKTLRYNKERKKKTKTPKEVCTMESRLAAWSPAAPSVTGASNFRCIKDKREKNRGSSKRDYKFYSRGF